MRVLITDDSALMRRAIREILAGDPAIEVVGVARHGGEAVAFAKRLRPDVITLDIEMPEMDGITALRHIMRESPTRVLMLSSLTTEGSHAALRALSLGAADVLAKDASAAWAATGGFKEELIRRVKALGAPAARASDAPRPRGPDGRDAAWTYEPGAFDAICIGSSTGGPAVLESILACLPAALTTPIVVAQHMPRVFTESMARRLASICRMPVVHAGDGDALAGGTVHIAPGEQHLQLRKAGPGRWALAVGDEPTDHRYRPSVDALLSSAAAAIGRRTLAIVLSGIGDDGLRGAQALHAKGAPILAQSPETCVVYGMPRAVTEAGLVAASLTPSGIARCLLTLAPTSDRADAARLAAH